MADTATFVDALQRAGFRMTEPRRTVARLVAGRSGTFTSASLVDEARARGLGIGRATVFRTLDVLAEVGTIERIDMPTGDHAYLACEPTHHHHVVCSSCGQGQDIDDAGLGAIVRDIARRTGYEVEGHRLEVFGRCPRCQERTAG